MGITTARIAFVLGFLLLCIPVCEAGVEVGECASVGDEDGCPDVMIAEEKDSPAVRTLNPNTCVSTSRIDFELAVKVISMSVGVTEDGISPCNSRFVVFSDIHGSAGVALNARSTSEGLLRYALILYVKIDPMVPFKLGIFLLKIELSAESKIVALAISP
jgi:hypothetical protein